MIDCDREMLDFEGQWFKHAGAKESQIRERFDCSPTAYYRRLNALLEDATALAYAPLTVRRLIRLREARRRARTA